MFCNHKKLWKRSEQSWLSSLNADSSVRMRSISLTLDTSTRRVRHMTGVIIQYFWWVLIDFWLSGLPSTPTINRNSCPSRQALLTFHQELTEPFIDLMAKYSGWPPSYCPRGRPAPGFSGPWLSPWLCPAMPSPPTGEDSGTCACNIVSMEMRRKMRRTRRLLVRRRDISLNKPWGWGGKDCRRQRWILPPWRVTSWVCRLQNGVLSNKPGLIQETFANITNILQPDLITNDAKQSSKTSVQRSNSSHSIGDNVLPKHDKYPSTISELEEQNQEPALEADPRPLRTNPFYLPTPKLLRAVWRSWTEYIVMRHTRLESCTGVKVRSMMNRQYWGRWWNALKIFWNDRGNFSCLDICMDQGGMHPFCQNRYSLGACTLEMMDSSIFFGRMTPCR